MFAMEFRYPEEYSKSSSSEEIDGSDQNDDTGIGRSYECVFCKRGFTTAQALGGHMNIHRKDRAKPKRTTFSPSTSTSTSSKLVDDYNYADLGFYSPIPRRAANNYYSSTTPEVDSNYYYPQFYYPTTIRSPSHLHYPHRDVLAEDWSSSSLSLYSNPFCVPQNKDKPQDNTEEDGLDLELRLGYHP